HYPNRRRGTHMKRGRKSPAAQSAGQKLPVTMRALTQRINRKLSERRQRLYKARGARQGIAKGWTQTGDYYVVDTRGNVLVSGHVNPEELGRELGVLKPWEAVGEPD